jgi:hypothetical protein
MNPTMNVREGESPAPLSHDWFVDDAWSVSSVGTSVEVDPLAGTANAFSGFGEPSPGVAVHTAPGDPLFVSRWFGRLKTWMNKPWVSPLLRENTGVYLRDPLTNTELVERKFEDHWTIANDPEAFSPAHARCPYGKFIGEMVALARAVFGVAKDTPANRLAVRSYLRKAMEQNGHRPQHIARDLPIAISLIFVPSAWDLTAAEMEKSTRYQELKRQVNHDQDFPSAQH